MIFNPAVDVNPLRDFFLKPSSFLFQRIQYPNDIMNISKLLVSVLLSIPMLHAMAAEPTSIPIITFHTNIYSLHGSSNSFTFYLGSTDGTSVEVDCGFGVTNVEITPAVFDTTSSSIQGTPITCCVSADAEVRVYGDPSKIDFVDMEGCYISDISWPNLSNVEILNLKYNELSALNLSHMKSLQAAYLSFNPFSAEQPLVVGSDKPQLQILEINMVDHLSSDFDLADYPMLRSFSAFSCPDLTKADTSNSPHLLQLSIDGSNVQTLDLSNNPELIILNTSETRVTELDLSHCPNLRELYCQHEATINQQYKMSKLDISKNPLIRRLYLNGNNIAELQLSHLSDLLSLGCRRNKITELNFDGCPELTLVDVSLNYMNFNTLPLPRETFSEYQADQYPLPVDRVYPEGAVIDFSNEVIRPDGSVTYAALLSVSRENPGEPVELSSDYFTFDNGKINLLKACPDSVYVSFYNPLFPETTLNSSRFMVKTADEFGKPLQAVSFVTSVLAKNQKFYVGIEGASQENPISFYVDFGDGQLREFFANSSDIPTMPNVEGSRKGATTSIYTPEGVDLTALKIDSLRLNGPFSVENAAMLRELEVTNSSLASISLTWNRCLSKLNLSGNNLTLLDLSAPNPYYAKTMLGDIRAANNKLSVVQLVDPYGWRNIDLSNNALSEFSTTHATGLKSLRLANNAISQINLADCEALSLLDLKGNQIEEIAIPDYILLDSLDISDNYLSFSTIPRNLSAQNYIYAPQRPIIIPTKAPSVNISAQCVEINGDSTQFLWKFADSGVPVADGDIISSAPGKFIFKNPDLGNIYCELSHKAFPEFAGADILRTSTVATAPAPTCECASFTTLGNSTIGISLAATDNNTQLYIDWSGDGYLEQYNLKKDYQVFEAETKKGYRVRCLSYDADRNNIAVFSIRNASLGSLDISKLSQLYCLGLYGTILPLEDIVLPQNNNIRELLAESNFLKSLPLENFPALRLLAVNDNLLPNLNLSLLPELETCYASSNLIEEVNISNPKLWELSLVDNPLSEIATDGMPAMQQLWLSGCNLSEINVDNMPALKAISLDGNNFGFSSLPLPRAQWILYNYKNQKLIDAPQDRNVVDLSSQASAYGVESSFAWFADVPYVDENGLLTGNQLSEGEDYTIEGGVSTFLKSFDNIICVITNPWFPDLYLCTDFLNVVADGVDGPVSDAPVVEYYDINGLRVSQPAHGGIYIRRDDRKVEKIIF